ncbi:MAG: glycoside hydrolase family 2 protein [Clostridiales bacterium]|nr:glycoside hydrolase family 2 protein [Clostridiales bacterium]
MTISEPKLWNTETPYLYTCVCRLAEEGGVIDETVEKFGVRTLQLDSERGLRINGSTVKLRGTCIHHDNGVIGAGTFERAEERRVQIMKQAGFNAIRSAHHPMSKAMLEACDRLGMLVMDEAFDMWQVSKSAYDYSLHFDEWWERDLEAMVSKDYNHPSVIMYSIGNEIFETGTKKGSGLNRKMAEKIRSVDGTRYVTNCVNGFMAAFPYMGEIMRELAGEKDAGAASQESGNSGARDGSAETGVTVEPAGEINQFMMNIFQMQDRIAGSRKVTEILEETFAGVDIAGYNYMVDRYDNEKKLYPNRVIVGSETCPPDIGRIWGKVKACSNVIGDFTWTGWDYLGEAGVGAFAYDGGGGFFKPYPALLAFPGDIDITGHRRPMSYYREIAFGLRKDPYIAVQRDNRYGQKVEKTQWCGGDTVASWTWPGFEGKPAVIEVFSNAQEVELLVNGKALGRKAAGEATLYKVEFEVEYQPGSIEAVNYTDGVETGRTMLKTAGKKVVLAADADSTELKCDGTGLSFIMISLTDEEGNQNLWDKLPVTVEVEGPAVLQGFGSADPFSLESFFDSTRTTYDGKVLAVVRALGEAGKITVKISAPGCEARTLLLEAE